MEQTYKVKDMVDKINKEYKNLYITKGQKTRKELLDDLASKTVQKLRTARHSQSIIDLKSSLLTQNTSNYKNLKEIQKQSIYDSNISSGFFTKRQDLHKKTQSVSRLQREQILQDIKKVDVIQEEDITEFNI